MTSLLVDALAREVRYLRLSVTDRCNLRCLYCAREDARPAFIPHEKILSYEEMLDLVGALLPLGVEKVRLTGGEPFVRKGFVSFLEALRNAHPQLDLRLTTNATLLAPHMERLAALRLNALNISYDTFSAVTFRQITGVDMFAEAAQGLEAALASGIRVKINAVALKGVNDHELPRFLELAAACPVDVRFIEYMPLGGRGQWTAANFWPAAEILARANALAELSPVDDPPAQGEAAGEPARQGMADPPGTMAVPAHPQGPARLFNLVQGRGRFGLISPLSNHFCATCNRLRITADGRVRPCLFSDEEFPIRDILRAPDRGMEEVLRVVFRSLRTKPLGHELLAKKRAHAAVIRRGMSSIGG